MECPISSLTGTKSLPQSVHIHIDPVFLTVKFALYSKSLGLEFAIAFVHSVLCVDSGIHVNGKYIQRSFCTQEM